MKTKTKKPPTARSLSATLAIAFLALSVVVLLISGGLQIFSNFQAQQAIIASQQQLNAQDASKAVSSFFQEKFTLLETVGRLAKPDTVAPAEQEQILGSLLGRQPAFRQLVLLNAQDQQVAQVSRLSQAASGQLTEQFGGDLLAQTKQGKNYVSPVYIDPNTSEPLVVMASPATNALGDFQGTLIAEVNLKFMWDLIDQLKVGETGTAFVVDKQGNLIALSDIARVLRGDNVRGLDKVSEFINSSSSVDLTPAKSTTGIQGTTVVATYVPLGTPDWAVVTEMSVEEAYREVIRGAVTSIGITLAIAVLAGLLGVYLARRLAVPLVSLTDTAARIAEGEIELQAVAGGPREVGTLAHAFNNMTARLRDLIDSLETRVEMRTAQLRTSTDVGRAATSILDTNQLLREVVNLIAERFGFYYAAVFTLDDTGKWAVLREATGEAGRVLKEREHRLEIGGQSMVSTAMTTRHSRIALDVGDEAARFANPLLPETRSEVALPLIVGDRVLGALDVQSVQAAAFDETSTAVLQSMADQIAIALNNAAQYRREQSRAQQTTHLLEATAELTALGQTADLYNRIVKLTSALLSADSAGLWQPLEEDELVFTYAIGGMESLVGQRVRSGEGIAGRVHATGLMVRLDDARTSKDAAIDLGELPVRAALAVPMIWQERVIGVLIAVHSQGNRTFTSDDESLAQLLAAQAAAAIENIRLREQQQRTLDELNNLNRRLTGESWRAEVLGEALTHEYRPFGSAPIESTGLSLQIPIEVHGEPIGAITIEDERRRELSDDERSLIQGVVQQMSLALENRRLADIAQRTAQREKQIAQAADKIHRASDMESILRTAVEEVSRIVGVEEVGIQLGLGTRGGNGHPRASTGVESLPPEDGDSMPEADTMALPQP